MGTLQYFKKKTHEKLRGAERNKQPADTYDTNMISCVSWASTEPFPCSFFFHPDTSKIANWLVKRWKEYEMVQLKPNLQKSVETSG